MFNPQLSRSPQSSDEPELTPEEVSDARKFHSTIHRLADFPHRLDSEDAIAISADCSSDQILHLIAENNGETVEQIKYMTIKLDTRKNARDTLDMLRENENSDIDAVDDSSNVVDGGFMRHAGIFIKCSDGKNVFAYYGNKILERDVKNPMGATVAMVPFFTDIWVM